MKIQVIMPKMGESLQEGTITKWLKKEGETVERDEMILEISTDKVDTEVPAPNAGVLTKIIAQEGETISVGEPIAEIETEAAKSESNVATEIQAEKAPQPKAHIQAPQQAQPEHEEFNQTKPAQESLGKSLNDENIKSPEQLSKGSVSGHETDLIMPKMGESLQEGTITKWLKKEGDKVERDEMILEISTDKVDTEVPSPVEGILSAILVKEGETVEVGAIIAKVSTGEKTADKAEPLPNQATRKAAEAAHENFEKRDINTQSASQPDYHEEEYDVQKEIPRKSGEKFFSPLVRSIAEENKIGINELNRIFGTGQSGRITKDDILKYIESRGKSPAAQPTTASQPAKSYQEAPAQQTAPKVQSPAPKAQPSGQATGLAKDWGDDVEVIPMDRIRQIISEHMVMSKHTSAHVTSVAEADVTGIVKFREKHKDEFQKKEGYKLTYTPFLAMAGIEALKAFPMVNVSVDGKNIIRHKKVNMGIATALPDGNLIVPVIKGAESMNLTGIARSINDLSNRARSKKLNPDDIIGGTFTMTNVGTFGTLFGTPVINQPQTGILGVGAIKKRAVVREFDGEDIIVIRNMIYVSITYDHRVIDGQLAGQYIANVVKNLESMNENTIRI